MFVVFILSLTLCIIYLAGLAISFLRKEDMFRHSIFNVIFVFSIATLSYFFIPKDKGDLTIHLYMIRRLIGISGESQWLYLTSDALIVRNLYYLLISMLGDENLVKPITTFIFYGIVFSNLKYIRKKYVYGANESNIYLITVFAVFGFCSIWGSIRMPLSWAISSYAIIRGIESDKFSAINWIKSIICFLCAALIHIGGLIPIICFIIYKIFGNTKRLKFILVFSSFGVGTLSNILSNNTSLYGNLLYSKLDEYVNTGTYHIAYRLYIAEIAILAVVSFLLFTLSKEKMNEEHQKGITQFSSCLNYLELLVIAGWGTVFFDQIFNREIYFIMLMSFPIWVTRRKSAQKIHLSYFDVIVLVVLGLFIAYNISVLKGAYRIAV